MRHPTSPTPMARAVTPGVLEDDAANDTGVATLPEPWASRMRRLIEAGSDHAAASTPGWDSLIRDATRARQPCVVVQALLKQARAFRCSGDARRAETTALRARRLAIAHGLGEEAFEAGDAYAYALHLQGRQVPALVALVGLLDSQEASAAKARAHRGAWVRLALFYTDCGAWSLAHRALRQATRIDLAGNAACWRWDSISRGFAVALPVVLAGHPLFDQALRLPHEQPRAEAAEAWQVCADALAQIDAAAADMANAPPAPVNRAALAQARSRARAMRLLSGAVQGDGPSLDALALTPPQPPSGDRNGWWFERLGLAFGCILAQRTTQALQVLQDWEDGPLPGLPPCMHERASYLRFAALQQAGRAADALAAFQRYAGIAAERLAKLQVERLPLPVALRPDDAAGESETASMLLPPYLREVLRVMALDPGRDLAIENLAQTVGITSRALRKAFRQYLATSPADHLTRLRLQRLRERLVREPDCSSNLAELARWAGFSSSARMVSLYRERYGSHPRG